MIECTRRAAVERETKKYVTSAKTSCDLDLPWIVGGLKLHG